MKKTIISALALMLGVLGFSGCTKTDDNISVEVNGGKTITFVAEMDSRTIMTGEKPNFSTNWVVGDKVGLYSFNTEYDNEDGSHSQTNYNRNRTFTVKSVSNGVATMTGTTYNSASSTGTHMFYGYYPCVENAKDEYTAVNMNIPSVQNMPVSETATFDPAANIMVAKPMSVNLNATNLTFNNIRFRHTVAFINLSTKAISAEGVSGDEIVSSVKFEAVGISENPTLAGDFQFNLEDGTMTFTKSESAVTVNVPANTKLSDLSAWIVTNPFELTADDELVITITTDAHTIIKNVSIAKNFEAANVYTLNLTIDNKCEISVIVPEEPALDGTILWSENWTGYSKDTQPSDATNVYNNEVVTYTYGKAGTKVYEENLAKGTAPELLLARDGGLWNIHNIPTGNCKLATLSFKINKSSDTFCAISTDTNGVSISEVSITESYVHEYAITFSDGVKTFDLKFSNSSSSNSRLDDIELVVGKKIHKATPPTITVDSKDAGNGTFTASWTAIDGISQYAWRLTTDADKTTNVQSGKVNSTEITVAGLDVSTKYVLYVKSLGDGENYKDSEEASKEISFKVETPEPEIDYVVLPFSFNDNGTALAKIVGVTVDGVGDYGTVDAKIALKAAGNKFTIKYNTAATSLSFNTNQNGSRGTSVITVSGSTDGIGFTTIQTIKCNEGQNKKTLRNISAIDSTYRYIQISLTTKGDNIGIGKIDLK